MLRLRELCGALQSVTFKETGTGGVDIFEVKFEHGLTEWRTMFQADEKSPAWGSARCSAAISSLPCRSLPVSAGHLCDRSSLTPQRLPTRGAESILSIGLEATQSSSLKSLATIGRVLGQVRFR